ncbi:MAG: beta-ketoacyl synthase N-terminal-like domain-containing protein, partial [Caldilinea sp.]
MQPGSGATSQQVLLALREARKKIEGLEYRQREPIAIVGIGCRFPGQANTPERFWEVLRTGRDCVGALPANHHPDGMPGAAGVLAAFLDQVDHFDPSFFGISPREAKWMDPQQRLLLETCWEALEAAHLVPDTLFDSDTGVFVGLCNTDY